MPYLMGMAAGFVLIMLAYGLLTDLAGRVYQGVLPWLKWIGVIYMAWLAVSLFLPSRHGEEDGKARNARFCDSLLLQIVNPKVILYGLTIYSSFHALLSGNTALPAAEVRGRPALLQHRHGAPAGVLCRGDRPALTLGPRGQRFRRGLV